MKTVSCYAVTAFLLLVTMPAFSQHMHHDMGKMALPADTSATGKEVYSCPMHPDVVSDKPGKCPKCGMKLNLIIPKPVDGMVRTNPSVAPGSGDKMPEGMDTVGKHTNMQSDPSVRTNLAVHDSTANCQSAQKADSDSRPSCCAKKPAVSTSSDSSKSK